MAHLKFAAVALHVDTVKRIRKASKYLKINYSQLVDFALSHLGIPELQGTKIEVGTRLVLAQHLDNLGKHGVDEALLKCFQESTDT